MLKAALEEGPEPEQEAEVEGGPQSPRALTLIFSGMHFIFLFICLFLVFETVLFCPGWPQTHYVSKGDLEFECWDYARQPTPSSALTEHFPVWTQWGILVSKLLLRKLSLSPPL